MRKPLLMLLCLSISFVSAKAQSRLLTGAEMGLFSSGQYYNLSSLNKVIQADGGGGFYNFYGTRGAYVQDGLHKFVFAAGFSDGTTSNTKKGSVATITSQTGFITLGYKLIEKKSFALYPELSYGLNALRLERYTTNSGTRAFSVKDIASNGFSISSQVDDLDLGAEVRWYSPSSLAAEHFKIGIGLKAGCLYYMESPDWHGADKQAMTGVPSTPAFAPYLQLRLFFLVGDFKK